MLKYIICSLFILPIYAYSVTLPIHIQLQQENDPHDFSIVNSDNVDHYYKLLVHEISRPDEKISIINSFGDDIWVSEPEFSLSSGSKKQLTIDYHGKQSNVERYFKIEVNEMSEDIKSGHLSQSSITVMLSPIDAVLKFNSIFNDSEGQLENQGNTSFFLIEDSDCRGSTFRTLLVLPGNKIKLPILKDNTNQSIGFNDTKQVIYSSCGANSNL